MSALPKIMDRNPGRLSLAVVLALLGSIAAASAQNVENGRRLAERWCAECHTVGPGPGKSRARPFAAIAAKENISAEMIVSFLHLPHATMANAPLTGNDTQDLAAYIMGMKK